uniref:Uncharacterized protein n=1 Tax=Candidatus Kentrum sp. TUN TaxID=2126343 RepID=A0A450ZGR0_9GAMM|nr:MAG: hypothetical protein BECKTUN1418D_GA0071000_101713 [Candidatus Kentron sp. TUN]VFK55263.1 MAG: hypothetical protein BECKTUN1418F_GA0071002_106615 [Candidatus Kentron sp. TUN]VFK55434.1 MAG: hypothetical protein BECKTUN1418E_GA0071001_102920 [Candidatus Kentron sp. TUN]
MISLDSTTIKIIAVLVSVGIFIAIEFTRRKEINVINIITISAAVFSLFPGYQLIAAALEGDTNNLPEMWREYLAVAGVVIIGLSLQFIIKTFRDLIIKPGDRED